MGKIAIVFASKGGQTRKIARYMDGKLQEFGHSTQLIDTNGPVQPLSSNVDTVIYGSPVYRGKFLPSVKNWVTANRAKLATTTSALFLVCLNAADKHDSARADDDRLLRKFMVDSGWIPDYVTGLAGALNYRDYGWILRRIMKRISSKAGGDTDVTKNFEYTDWAQVDAFLASVTSKSLRSRFTTRACFPQYNALDSQMRSFEQTWSSQIKVEKTAAEVFSSLNSLSANDMRMAKVLAKIRTLGKSARSPKGESFIASAERFGNIRMPTVAPYELISGLVGKFWQLNFGILRLEPQEFAPFKEPGFTKVVTNFWVEPVPGSSSSVVHGEMRIHSTSPDAAKKFKVYWRLLGLGIHFYMRSALTAVKRKAERAETRSVGGERDPGSREEFPLRRAR